MASLLRKFCSKKKIAVKENERIYTEEDYDKTYSLLKMVLKFTCFKVAVELTKSQTRLWHFIFTIAAINAVFGTIAEILATIIIATHATSFYEDAPKVFKTITCFGFCLLSVVKGINIQYNRKVLERLYFDLRELWPRGEVSEEEHRIVNESMKQLHRLCKGYVYCNNAMLVSFTVPLEILMIARFFGYESPRVFTFEYYMPFDGTQPGVYELMLHSESYAAITVVWWTLAWDMLFCSFLAHITMQFDLLACRVRKLIYVPIDQQLADSYPLGIISKELLQEDSNVINSFNEHDWEVRHGRELASIVRRHCTLIRLAEDVETLFSFGLLINFLDGSIMICFSGFCCVLFEKWNEWAYKACLVASLIQIWMLSCYGQKLLDSSYGVAEALYQCGWYNGSKKLKSSILIMLQRCQKGIHVTTYGFTVICLESYSTILKTSWSYFTLLMNFYKGVGEDIE